MEMTILSTRYPESVPISLQPFPSKGKARGSRASQGGLSVRRTFRRNHTPSIILFRTLTLILTLIHILDLLFKHTLCNLIMAG